MSARFHVGTFTDNGRHINTRSELYTSKAEAESASAIAAAETAYWANDVYARQLAAYGQRIITNLTDADPEDDAIPEWPTMPERTWHQPIKCPGKRICTACLEARS